MSFALKSTTGTFVIQVEEHRKIWRVWLGRLCLDKTRDDIGAEHEATRRSAIAWNTGVTGVETCLHV